MQAIYLDGFHVIEYSIQDIEDIRKSCDIFGFIYVTENLINHKLYIGQKALTKKWKTYLGSGVMLRRAIKKYGKNNFKRYIINYACDEKELNNMEFIYTKLFNVVENKQWYNIIYGGGFAGLRGIKFSEEHRKNISKAKIGEKNPNYGKKYSEEEKQKMRHRVSGEKNAMFGKCGELSPNYGRKHSEETKKKMSLAALGENNHNYHKTWSKQHRQKYEEYYILHGASTSKETYCYDLDGNFIKAFRNATLAAKFFGLNHSHISSVCRNQFGRCGKYQWRYAKDVNYSKEKIGRYIKNNRIDKEKR